MNDIVTSTKTILGFSFIIFSFFHIFLADYWRRRLPAKRRRRSLNFNEMAIIFTRIFGAGLLLVGFFYTSTLPSDVKMPVALIPFGALIALFGLMLVLSAYSTLKHSAFLGSEKLIISGPYKKTRHPIYSGTTMVFIGMSLVLSSMLGLLYALISFILIYVLTYFEEKELQQQHGKTYSDYASKTHRFLPLT